MSDSRDKYAFDITGLDGESRDILKAIYEHGGETTTPTIQNHAAVARGEAHYRFEKLEERGLISTYTAVPESGDQEVTHARVTDAGRDAIEKGLFEDITDANTNLRQLRRELSELTEHLQEKPDQWRVNRQLDDLRHMTEALQNDLEEVRETAREAADTSAQEAVDQLRSDVDAIEEELARTTDEISRQVTEIRESVSVVEEQGERNAQALTELEERVCLLEEREAERQTGVDEEQDQGTQNDEVERNERSKREPDSSVKGRLLKKARQRARDRTTGPIPSGDDVLMYLTDSELNELREREIFAEETIEAARRERDVMAPSHRTFPERL